MEATELRRIRSMFIWPLLSLFSPENPGKQKVRMIVAMPYPRNTIKRVFKQVAYAN